MGVYIPNIEMPKKCGGCQFNVYLTGGSYEWEECVLLNDDITHFDIRRDDCPLIEIDLVRCGECKFQDECILGSYGVSEHGFCYKGERRE